ncbi:MAG: polysulfide reductase [Desulfarculus sp.]|jgi:molybdopterin-containing oxidoreductase family membrane subunit|nr:MAG: polysulfide reductase [Desulfarculus sp.]
MIKNGKLFGVWMAFLIVLIVVGIVAYARQTGVGHISSAMRDQVSWGFFISNYVFFVGVAAAAVLLVVPAYIYHFKPLKEIVLFGEMAAIVAVIIAILSVIVDLGHASRLWHILPLIGKMHFPNSLLVWNVLFLNGYLIINLVLVGYAWYMMSQGKEYNLALVWPLILLSIPWAVSIHTSTAFVFSGVVARPFWNASILAPRFLASAFCSGPAIMLIVFQLIRKYSKVEIENRALFKVAELIAYAIGINLFLLGAEIFKEFYSGSIHKAPLQYLYFGLHGNYQLVPWIWIALLFNSTAFVLFLLPKTREKLLTMNIGAALVIIGVFIEKGIGFVIPGFIPDTLGEIYQYWPTLSEFMITVGIWAFGALLYTLMVKFTLPVYSATLLSAEKQSR